jgi:hypothetical protein
MAANLSEDREKLRDDAQRAIETLRDRWDDDDLGKAKTLVDRLRKTRDFDVMADLAEAVSRTDPDDLRNRRLYAQSLIETGKATAAVDVLKALSGRLAPDGKEFFEAQGSLGRAYKQIFMDARDKSRQEVRNALQQAIEAYAGPYRTDPALNTWHGANLVALLRRARLDGIPVPEDLDGKAIAEAIVAVMEQQEQQEQQEHRDEWHLATLAEASLGLEDWSAAESHIRKYVTAGQTDAFQLGSTIRQFENIWGLEHLGARGKALLDILRAQLLKLQGGALEISPDQVRTIQGHPKPEPGQLEAILGEGGIQTYQWFRTALERARSVAAIRQRLGSRIGTGFLVKAGALGLEPADELLVLTNFHVVSKDGGSPYLEPDKKALRPEDAEVVFEAVDPSRVYAVEEIVWSSEPGRHDASLLRISEAVTDIEPLPLSKALPLLEDHPRVYIIGHPGGRDLAFSFQDNELMDHEGPPSGHSPIPGVCRVHYHAPTEGGSSGSPVFNASLWEVIALHHMGGKTGMKKLNGQEGTYAANEGISIQSIAAAIRQSTSAEPAPPR